MYTSIYRTNTCIAANENIPNIPKKLVTDTVNKLIGMCNPIKPPNTLKKNRNKTPIAIFTVVCPIKRNGFVGTPINSTRNIKLNKMIITTLFQSFLHSYYKL